MKKFGISPYQESLDRQLRSLPNSLLAFKGNSWDDGSLMYGTQQIITSNKLSNLPPKNLEKALAETLQKDACTLPAQFKKRAPRHWPKSRSRYIFRIAFDNILILMNIISTVELSHEEAIEIVRQEWKTGLCKSVIESRLNRHCAKEGPVVTQTPNGQNFVSASTELHDPRLLNL